MPLSKLSARFKKPAEAPAAVPEAEPATPEAPAVEAVAAAEPAAPVPSPASEPPKASRLVEGGRPSLRDRLPTGAAMATLAQAQAALKPVGKPLAAAAAIVAALGLGYGAGMAGRADSEAAATARWNEAAAGLRQSNGEIVRLAAELKTVKAGLDGLRGERDRSRLDSSGKQAQLIERVERAGQDNAARIGKLGEQLDRLEKAQKDPARTQALVDRLDRIEKGMQVAAVQPPAPVAGPAPTPPPKPVAAVKEPSGDVDRTGSLAEPKKAEVARADGAQAKAESAKPEIDPRKVQLEGYAVRDIDDGYALIETKSGRFVEVAVGQTLPGVGRVEAIERRGRQWVVVTAKGFVGERWN